MLNHEAYRSVTERVTTPFFTAEEVFFDDLIEDRHIGAASDFITEYVDELQGEMDYYGYHPGYFRPALKKLALPMYRKMHADRTGRPYYRSNEEIPLLYSNSIEMIRELLSVQQTMPDIGEAKTRHLRGSLTELTIFALAVRGMQPTGNDFTIIPSAAEQDVSPRDKNGDYTGIDFTIHDRVRDETYPLQAKTSNTGMRYQDSIAIISLNEFVKPFDVTILQLQQEIIRDADHSSFIAHRAARKLQHFLSSALKDVEKAS